MWSGVSVNNMLAVTVPFAASARVCNAIVLILRFIRAIELEYIANKPIG